MSLTAKPEKTDIAVVGAGPAGVSAAVSAAGAGAKVVLLDEFSGAGGQYYKQPASVRDGHEYPTALAENISKGRELLKGLEHPGIDLQFNTLAWNVSADERILHLYGTEGSRALKAKRVIFAAGVYERVMPFPGWTLPGVMTVGAAQLMMKSQGMLPGRKFLLAGTGPLLQLAAVQILEAGGDISAILELQSRSEFLLQTPRLWGHWDKLGQGMANQKKLLDARVPLKYGHIVTRALGEEEVCDAVIMKVDGKGRPRAGSEQTLDVDTICLNYGFIPAIELPSIGGCEQYYDPGFDGFAIKTNGDLETSVAGFFAVGETRGIGGADVALLEGRLAGTVAAMQLGFQADSDLNRLRLEQSRARDAVSTLGKMFPIKPGLCELASDEVTVCRCEEISAGEIRDAVRMGVTRLNQLKPWTRAGMGRCQGRICTSILRRLLAVETGLDLQDIKPFTARAPVKPVPMESVGGPVADAGELNWDDHVTGYGMARTG